MLSDPSNIDFSGMLITKRIPKLVSDWRLGSAGFAYNTIFQVGEVSGLAQIPEGASAWSPTIERYF